MGKMTMERIVPSILEKSVQQAVETYSNVHRGSGYRSAITTRLFEEARKIALDYLKLSPKNYTVIFCSPRRCEMMLQQLNTGTVEILSSSDFDLPIGIRAMAIKKSALPKGIPLETGGGATKLIARDWVIWAGAPDRYEAGTPSVINIIVFANFLKHFKPGINDSPKNNFTTLTTAEILYSDNFVNYSGNELLEILRNSLSGKSLQVPTEHGIQNEVYLDNSASTPALEQVVDTYKMALEQPETTRKEIIEEVKSICADMFNAPVETYETIFTSNTTEAINVVAKGLSKESINEIEPVILNTILEHSSNDLPWRQVPNHSLIRLDVDENGLMDVDALDKLMTQYNQSHLHGKKRITLVAMNGASNVLGTLNDLASISKIVKKHGARLLVDAAQLVAHQKIDIQTLDIDYMAFPAHKVYAPFGCGVLLARKGTLNYSTWELEGIKSSGEENSAGIAALGKALVLLKRVGMELLREEEKDLTRYALEKLSGVPGIKIYGIKDPLSPLMEKRIGVVSFDLKNKFPNKIAGILSDRGGIGVRYGCHCAHVIVKHVLKVPRGLEQFQRVIQVLFPKMRFPGVVRISLGIGNTRQDIDRLVNILNDIISEKKPTHSSNNVNMDKKAFQSRKDTFITNRMENIFS